MTAYIYNVIIRLTKSLFPIVIPFRKSLQQFYSGRQNIIQHLKQNISKKDNIIWIHCASLGEFEQGRPVLENIKKQHPNYKIVLTFFSPSGYNIRKNYDQADVITYLPWDTKKDIKDFLDVCNPKLALFVKYEIWPNLLNEIRKRKIDCILFSAIFKPNQSYFKLKSLYLPAFNTFDKIFVQDPTSLELLLNKFNLKNVEVAGDTRFDRVYDICQQSIDIPIIKQFTKNAKTLIAGSTWEKDDDILCQYINQSKNTSERFIIAPHKIDENHLKYIEQKLKKAHIRYSQYTIESKSQVLIIDNIGMLNQLYYYADIAYIGGGFGVGIHNILEPAIHEVPIIIGPNHKKFKEAQDLIQLGSCFSINNEGEGLKIISKLFNNLTLSKELGEIAKKYITQHIGGTQHVLKTINYLLRKH